MAELQYSTHENKRKHEDWLADELMALHLGFRKHGMNSVDIVRDAEFAYNLRYRSAVECRDKLVLFHTPKCPRFGNNESGIDELSNLRREAVENPLEVFMAKKKLGYMSRLSDEKKNVDLVSRLLSKWETLSYEKDAEFIRRFLKDVETKVEHHGYPTKEDVCKDLHIVNILLLKLDDDKKSIRVDCLKIQIEYYRASKADARMLLWFIRIFKKYKDVMSKKYKDWMTEKKIHIMKKGEISELVSQLGGDVAWRQHELRELGEEVPEEPEEEVVQKKKKKNRCVGVYQVIDRKIVEYTSLEQKVKLRLTQMNKLSEAYKPTEVNFALKRCRLETERILGLLWMKLAAFGELN